MLPSNLSHVVQAIVRCARLLRAGLVQYLTNMRGHKMGKGKDVGWLGEVDTTWRPDMMDPNVGWKIEGERVDWVVVDEGSESGSGSSLGLHDNSCEWQGFLISKVVAGWITREDMEAVLEYFKTRGGRGREICGCRLRREGRLEGEVNLGMRVGWKALHETRLHVWRVHMEDLLLSDPDVEKEHVIDARTRFFRSDDG